MFTSYLPSTKLKRWKGEKVKVSAGGWGSQSQDPKTGWKTGVRWQRGTLHIFKNENKYPLADEMELARKY